MQDLNEKDWKVFKSKIGEWQEKFMDKLNKGYIEFLSNDKFPPSYKFWTLKEMIGNDCNLSGVTCQKSRSKVVKNLINLISEEVITFDDLQDFTDELKETIKAYFCVDNKYIKIKVTYKWYPKRFNRVMLVNPNLNLKELGWVILTCLGAEFEHMYMFEDIKNQYVDKTWLDEFYFENQIDYEKVTLKEVLLNSNNSFKLIYDTGEDWEFIIRVYDRLVQYESEEETPAICLSGKGDCIWEDYRSFLDEYLEYGYITEEGVLPWNIDYTDLSCFDKDLDLEEINDMLTYSLDTMSECENY